MATEELPRIDSNISVRKHLLPYCRLRYGQVWEDSIKGHRVECLDAAREEDVQRLMGDQTATLAIHDPLYNVIVGNANTERLGKTSLHNYRVPLKIPVLRSEFSVSKS
jgi:site-specific DNA-methyltransferase (adenine-specific)